MDASKFTAPATLRRNILLPRSSVAGSPVVALLFLLLGSGCVSQSAYEEAQSAAQVEREAHERADARAAVVEQSLAELQGSIARRESALAEQERRLAEADLNLKLANQERDASGQLVDQLRGELARVGDHLRVYSEQKQRLAEELRVAEDRSRQLDEKSQRVERVASVVRDLSLLEGPAIHAGSILVGSDGRDPVLSAPAQALGSGATLSADAQRIVKALARLAELHPYTHFVISQPVSDSAASDPALLRALSEALIGEGVASARVAVAMPETPADAAIAPATARSEGSEAAGAESPKAQPSEARVIFLIQVADDSNGVSGASENAAPSASENAAPDASENAASSASEP